MDTLSQNPILGNSASGFRFFNLEYLFDQGISFFRQLFDVGNSLGTKIILIYNITAILLFILAIFFMVIISYTTIRMFEIRKKEREHLKHEIAEYAQHHAEKEKKMQEQEEISKNPRWIKTLNYLFSQHGSDWKLAVIEADSMLDNLMDQLGFKGENLGDKLKSASQSNFRNLSSAWEVHTIRNRIAHEGINFELSQREAKRIIALYEQIFREFGYI